MNPGIPPSSCFESTHHTVLSQVRRPLWGPSAFSLIEIVAAMAIVAIIAAATLPVLVRQIDYANQGIEATNLVALAAGLTQGSCSQRYVPSQANWATFIGTNIGWQLAAVQTNARNNSRVFLIDPNLVIGTVTANTLPYPPNARFIIVSSQPGPLPSNLSSGVPGSPADFNTLWNNPDNTIPKGTGWSFNPNGQGADLRVQRINLGSSFCRLVLTPLDPTNAAYSVDGFPATLISPGGKFDSYFLKGTVLSLYFWSNGVPTLQAAQVLQQDTSWFFCNGLWRKAPCPSDLSIDTLGSIVQNFYNNVSHNGMNPTTIYSDMTNYMGLYLQYAAGNFKNGAAQISLKNATTQLKNDVNTLVP